jgi:hypothetical protein
MTFLLLFFCLSWPGTMILLISASHIAWYESHVPLCPAVGWNGVSWAVGLGWCLTVIFLIPASQVARCEPLAPGSLHLWKTFELLVARANTTMTIMCRCGWMSFSLSLGTWPRVHLPGVEMVVVCWISILFSDVTFLQAVSEVWVVQCFCHHH